MNWGQLFVAITNRTGWTPSQILELTLGQLSIYVLGWVGEDSESHNGDGSFLFGDVGAFNDAAGIGRVQKKV